MTEMRSPQRPYSTGLWLLFAVVTLWTLLTTATKLWEGLFLALAAAAFVTAAVRAWRSGLVLDFPFLIDRSTIRTQRHDLRKVDHFEIGRPDGILDGQCLQIVSPTDGRRSLLSTRVYSLIPSKSHLSWLDATKLQLNQALVSADDA